MTSPPTLSIMLDWNEPDPEPDWWDADEDGVWTAEGSWSVIVEGFGEVLRSTVENSDGGFATLGEAVTAAEKWCSDRRMEIRTLGGHFTAVRAAWR